MLLTWMTMTALASPCGELDEILAERIVDNAVEGRFAQNYNNGGLASDHSGDWAAMSAGDVYVFHRGARRASGTRLDGDTSVRFVQFVDEDWLIVGRERLDPGIVVETRLEIFALRGRPVFTEEIILPGKVLQAEQRDGELALAMATQLALPKQPLYPSDEDLRRRERMTRAWEDLRDGRTPTEIAVTPLLNCEDVVRGEGDDTTILSVVRLDPGSPTTSMQAASVMGSGTASRVHFHDGGASFIAGGADRAINVVRFDIEEPAFAWEEPLAASFRVDEPGGIFSYFGASTVDANGAVWVATRSGQRAQDLTLSRIDLDGQSSIVEEELPRIGNGGAIGPLGHGFVVKDDRGIWSIDTSDPEHVVHHRLGGALYPWGAALTGDSYMVWSQLPHSAAVPGWSLAEWDGRSPTARMLQVFPIQAQFGHQSWVGGLLQVPYDEDWLTVVVGGQGQASLQAFERQDGELQWRWTRPATGRRYTVLGNMLVSFDGDFVFALAVESGKPLGKLRYD